MDNASVRGCRNLLIVVAVLALCVFVLPVLILGNWLQTAVTLPVITVPAEYYRQDWPSPNFELVNSLGGALLANIIVVFIAWRAWVASKGWTKEVPGRLQGALETLIGGLWGLTKDQAGNSPKVKNLLFPLVASIFFFLLAGNLGKLIPGVESIGVLHCAVYDPVPLNGHPVHEVDALGTTFYNLRVEGPLQIGTAGTSDSYRQCEAGFGEHEYIEEGYLVTELDPFFDDAVVVQIDEEGMTLNDVLAEADAQLEEALAAGLPESENREEVQAELAAGAYEAIKLEYSDPYAQYDSFAEVDFTIDDVIVNNANENGEVTLAFAAEEEEEHGGHGEDVGEEIVVGDATYVLPAGATLDTPLATDQTVVVRPELFGADATTRANQIYTVAPFIRGVSTDLSFTVGLALLAFVAIQYFGLSTLGPSYLLKFVNLPALGKGGLGPVDFVVGLFEIVSELGKIISLAFRLFGALFAGTVLFAVIMFLTGTLIPALILGLEIIVGTAQAGVFAILTLIFSAQAMISHHGDHDDHHDDGHHDHEFTSVEAETI